MKQKRFEKVVEIKDYTSLIIATLNLIAVFIVLIVSIISKFDFFEGFLMGTNLYSGLILIDKHYNESNRKVYYREVKP